MYVEQADVHLWGDLSKEEKMSVFKILRFHLNNNPNPLKKFQMHFDKLEMHYLR